MRDDGRRFPLSKPVDAHWIDPTSLEAFGRTVDRIKTLPVLLIVTFRPEFNAPWAGQSHVTSVALNRLGEPPNRAAECTAPALQIGLL